MTERMCKLAAGDGLKGFQACMPTRIVRATAKSRSMPSPPPYVAVQITRGGAAVDEQQSSFVRQGPTICSHCRTAGILEKFQGIYLEEGTWNGDDIFYAWGLLSTVLVSDRFRAFCIDNSLENIHLVPAKEYHFDFYGPR